MKISIKKLSATATLPTYQSAGASGFDLHADESTQILPQQHKLIKTGIAIALEEGYELQVRPRSGLALKHGISVLNTPGTVDSDYRGELKVILINHSDTAFTINLGDRIAQAVVQKVFRADFQIVEELDSTQRGTDGFGSTGI